MTNPLMQTPNEAEQESQNQSAGDPLQQGGIRQNSPDNQKPEPKIRTMKSDIAEFMKETKPSLIQILTKQVEYQPTTVSEKKASIPTRTFLISITELVVIGAAGWFSYNYFISQKPEIPITPGIADNKITDSPIFAEKTQSETSPRKAHHTQ